jgi:glyoxylase-like metal-dependent hydrolase (beta-lactamase superfamily II)
MRTRLDRRTFLTAAAAAGLATGWGPVAQAARDRQKGGIRLDLLADGVQLAQGAGGNVLVVAGPEGSLLVDGGSPGQSRALLQLVASDRSPVRTLINTHWHPDHTGSNEALGKAGATIIAHENTRLWMQRPIHVAWQDHSYPAMPPKALPMKTFYTEESLAFGGQELRLGHLGQAHTDGDIYVHLPKSNVLVAGDTVAVGSYPVSDWATGGWIRGLLESNKLLLKLCDGQTRIVPGTGPVVAKAHLQKQHDMLEVLTERIWQLMRKGMSDLDIVEAKPTTEYDADWGDSRQFVLNAYQGIWNHVREMRGIV